jgi:hypothetical protein
MLTVIDVLRLTLLSCERTTTSTSTGNHIHVDACHTGIQFGLGKYQIPGDYKFTALLGFNTTAKYRYIQQMQHNRLFASFKVKI